MIRIRACSSVLVAVVLLGCGATQPDQSVASRSSAPASSYAEVEVQIVDVVNEARRTEGRSPLAWNEDLAALARSHSRAMASGEVPFGHAGIGARLSESMAIRGARAAAENVSRQPRAAAEVAPRSIERWMGSPKHRKNLLGDYAVTGVGVARGSDGSYYVTQIFAP